MRYIKQPARSNSDNCEYEIVEDTDNKKLICFCKNLTDARTVVNAYNSAERSKEWRAKRKKPGDK